LPVYRTPGVYFERRDITPLGIAMPRTDITGFVGIAERGPLFEAMKIESWNQFSSVFGGFIAQGYLAYSVYGFFANGGRTCWVVRVAEPKSAGTASGEFSGIQVTAGSPGSWGNVIYVRPFQSAGNVTAVLVRYPDGSEQLIRAPFNETLTARDNLLDLPQGELDPKPAVRALVDIEDLGIATREAKAGFLEGGSDGLDRLKPEHFRQAFEVLAQEPDITIVAAPDLMPKLRVLARQKPPRVNCCAEKPQPPVRETTAGVEFAPSFSDGEVQDLQMALAAHAETLRYRFAILDAAGERANPRNAIAWRKAFPQTAFAALYYPWVLVDDPLRLSGLVRAIPPSGHMAGIFASSDRRRGVHKPPMNELLEEVSDVGFRVDDTDHAELNDENVNAIRVVPGRGVRILGARTLARDFLVRYINVRRLLSMMERALEQSLHWTVFEPNNQHLWAELDRILRSFLETLFEAGMLDGQTSEEAYFVRCDDETNTPNDTDNGRVVCRVGFRPPYPAEFVVVTLGITTDGVLVREEVEHA
jgi:uncharacterized protein